MEPVRLGVIGCGVIGTKHLAAAAAAEHIDIAAIADLSEPMRNEAADKFAPRKVYATAEELLADEEVEAVVLALPTGVRSKLGPATLAAGKHLLLEKPVAMNVGEVRELMDARGELVVACASSRPRWKPHAAAVTEFLAGEGVGAIRELHVRCLKAAGARPARPGPAWRLRKDLNGGGILVNWGCYDLDYMLGITGWKLRPRVVLAQTWPIHPALAEHIDPGSDAETHVTAMIRCEGGEIISYGRGEFVAAGGEDAWQIIGDAGSLRLTMVSSDPIRITHHRADAEKGRVEEVLWEGEEGWGVMHSGPVCDFASAIREGRQPATDLERSLILQQITDAIYESAATGRAVEIAD